MNIRNNRVYLLAYYRVGSKFPCEHFTASFFVAYAAIAFHTICNLFSSDKICCRIIGSYVR